MKACPIEQPNRCPFSDRNKQHRAARVRWNSTTEWGRCKRTSREFPYRRSVESRNTSANANWLPVQTETNIWTSNPQRSIAAVLTPTQRGNHLYNPRIPHVKFEHERISNTLHQRSRISGSQPIVFLPTRHYSVLAIQPSGHATSACSGYDGSSLQSDASKQTPTPACRRGNSDPCEAADKISTTDTVQRRSFFYSSALGVVSVGTKTGPFQRNSELLQG